MISHFFIDRPDFCCGALDRHYINGRHRGVQSADRAVSANHAAGHQRVNYLSRQASAEIVADTVAVAHRSSKSTA